MWNGRGGEMACSSEENLIEREVREIQVKLDKGEGGGNLKD